MTSLRPVTSNTEQVEGAVQQPLPTTTRRASIETLEAWTQGRTTDRAACWYKGIKSRGTPMYSDVVHARLCHLGTTLLKDRVPPKFRLNTWYGFHCGQFVTIRNPESLEDLAACIAQGTVGVTYTTPAACEVPPHPTPRYVCSWCECSVVHPIRKYAQVWCSERCITGWEVLQDWNPPKATPRFIVGQGFVAA